MMATEEETARALAGEGVDVTLTARSADALREVAEGLAGGGTRVHSISADVCEEGARRKILEEAIGHYRESETLNLERQRRDRGTQPRVAACWRSRRYERSAWARSAAA